MAKKPDEFLILQADYLSARNDGAFNRLYRYVLDYCIYAITCKLRKAKAYTVESVERYSMDAASQFLEMYLNHPDWKCEHFKARVNLDIKNVLYAKRPNHLRGISPDRFYYLNTEPLEMFHVKQEDDKIAESVETDREIMKTVYFAKTIKQYLQDVANIKGIPYVRRNISKLLDIYRTTRGPYGTEKGTNRESNAVRKDTQRIKDLV